MWISKKKFKALEKRIADLEVKVQSQRKETKEIIDNNIRSNNEVIRMIQLGLEAQRQALGIDNVKEAINGNS